MYVYGSLSKSRWMMFVDGEKLTIQGQDLLGEKHISPVEGMYWKKNQFIWQPNLWPDGYANVFGHSLSAYQYGPTTIRVSGAISLWLRRSNN